MSNNLLQEVLFIDHNIETIHFESVDYRPSEKGSVTLDVTRTGSFTKSAVTEENLAVMFDEVELSLVGYNLDGKTNEKISDAFKLSAKFNVVYLIPDELSEQFDSNFFESNGWFFRNYAHQCGHDVFASVLKNTYFDIAVKSIPPIRVDPEPPTSE